MRYTESHRLITATMLNVTIKATLYSETARLSNVSQNSQIRDRLILYSYYTEEETTFTQGHSVVKWQKRNSKADSSQAYVQSQHWRQRQGQRGAEARGSLSLRPAWLTYQVPGHTGLHRETCQTTAECTPSQAQSVVKKWPLSRQRESSE